MYYACMSVIQIRNVSEETHRRLKARAALEGKSLSEYLRLEIERLAARPTMEEMIERVASREPVKGGDSAAETIRKVRAEREAHLDDVLRRRDR
jgi:plasmid stability protein